MIFGWSGGLAVPESFFWLYPGLTSWAIIGRPFGAGVWWFCSASPATEVVSFRCDHLQTLDLAVVGRFSEGRPCRKNWTN